MMRRLPSFVICALFLSGFAAQANFSNYNSILIGDQAAGMGGAAAAMTEDGSAMAWYNPAALAKLKGKSFSAAVGIYKKFDTRFNNDSDIAKASLSVNQGFFRALPSSTGSIIRPDQISFLQGYTFALSILVPEYENYKGDIAAKDQSISTLNYTAESLWVGGAIAKEISNGDSLGLTIYYTARSVSKSVNDRNYIDATHSSLFMEDRNMTQNAVVTIVGWHHEIDENWRLGVSYRLPSLHVAGKAEINQTQIENGVIQQPVSERDLDTKARIPWKGTLGLAYVKAGNYRWAIDLTTSGPVSYGDVEKFELAEKIEHKQVWNLSIGFEKEWTDWLKTRAGIFSNYSAHPNPDPELVHGQGDHVDQAGFSANAAFRSGNIEYTFGGYYTGGRGRSVQRVFGSYEVVPKIQNVFTMLVGTSYYF